MNKRVLESEHSRGRRRSRAEVAGLVAGFEQSGLKRRDYCRRHGLSLATLKRYSKGEGSRSAGLTVSAERPAPVVSLIPVEVVERPRAQEREHAALYVELTGGVRIGVGSGFDAVTLRRLMHALGEV